MKHGKLLAVTVLAIILTAVVVIDLRPARGLKLMFFRYYHLEQLNKFTSVFNPVLALFYRPTAPLRQIDIQVSQSDVATMVGSLPKPYPAVFLSRQAAPEVPARVTIDDKRYEANIRIRGKSPRHWQDQQKSLRLDIKSNRPPGGISTLHLVIPYDRYFIAEAISGKIARDLGLPAGHQEPVWVTFNGVGGVYLALELADAQMIERNSLPVGMFYSEAELGPNPTFPFLFAGVESWRTTEVGGGSVAEYAVIEQLLAIINDTTDEEFYRRIVTLLDIEQFLRWQSHAVLISSDHQDDRHNAQILLNPASGKLMFFLSDPGFYEYGSSLDLGNRLLAGRYNQLAKRILTNPQWRARRDEIISDYLLAHEAELVDTIVSERQLIIPWLMRDPIKLHSNLRVWWMIRERGNFMKRHWELLGSIVTVKE